MWLWYGGWYESNSSFFSRKNNCNYNEIYIYQEHILYKVDIVWPQNFLHYWCTFSTFAWDTVCQSHSTHCWSIRTFYFTHVVFWFIFVIKKTASLEIIFQGAKEVEVRRCSIWTVGVWGRTFHLSVVIGPLCTDWCVVWHCPPGGGLDLTSCFAESFEFAFLTFLMSVHITLNWRWHFCSQIPLTWFLHCPRKCRPWLTCRSLHVECVLLHSPYISNLAPSNFHIFGSLKATLQRCCFENDSKLKCSVHEQTAPMLWWRALCAGHFFLFTHSVQLSYTW